ncbi:hypothetical protein D3C85_1400270 [compost metagenome]
MVGELHTLGITYIIEKSIKSSFRRSLRIQVAQRPRCPVTGILKRFSRPCIIVGKHREIHNSFTLHLNNPFLKWNR